MRFKIIGFLMFIMALTSNLGSVELVVLQPEDPVIHIKRDISNWISSSHKIDKKTSSEISNSVVNRCIEKNLQPELVLAIIDKESEFVVKSRSSGGCIGLMQVHFRVHKEDLLKMGINEHNIWKIDQNIDAGTKILRGCISISHSTKEALRRYNGAKNYTYSNSVINKSKLIYQAIHAQ